MTKKVLVVEDDRDLSTLFELILNMAGFEVSVSRDGRDAVARLNEALPEAITLDLHLPGVSGSDIYTMLAERNEAQRVLICSADVKEVSDYILMGANAITKPIGMDDLIQRVTIIVERSLALGVS